MNLSPGGKSVLSKAAQTLSCAVVHVTEGAAMREQFNCRASTAARSEALCPVKMCPAGSATPGLSAAHVLTFHDTPGLINVNERGHLSLHC